MHGDPSVSSWPEAVPAMAAANVRCVVSAELTLSWSGLKEWVGVRAQAGRLVPKGFPRSNSFGPAF